MGRLTRTERAACELALGLLRASCVRAAPRDERGEERSFYEQRALTSTALGDAREVLMMAPGVAREIAWHIRPRPSYAALRARLALYLRALLRADDQPRNIRGSV